MYHWAGHQYGVDKLNIEDSYPLTIGEFQIQVIKSGAPWNENCYLVSHLQSGEQAVIDPGGNAEYIIQAILAKGGRLRYLWLTHAHFDHVSAVAALCRRFDVICKLHKNDLRLLRQAPMYALRFSGKQIETPAPFQVYDFPCQFQFGGQSVSVISTPGHTLGSVCYALNGFIFTGDTLLYEMIGRTDMPGGEKITLINSVDHLVKSLPKDTIIFPGHGRLWSIAGAQVWWGKSRNDPPDLRKFEEGY